MADTPDGPVFDYDKLRQFLAAAPDGAELEGAIVNAPFTVNKPETALLFLGIMVLLLANKETGTIDRIALSNTELAKNTTDISYKPFEEIKIPLDYDENILVKAIKSNKPQDTTDWRFLFEPALTAEQARLNQASGGIAYSAVWPLSGINDGGALIFSYFQYLQGIGTAQHEFMKCYSALVIDRLHKSQQAGALSKG